jgi:hypothetical protein
VRGTADPGTANQVDSPATRSPASDLSPVQQAFLRKLEARMAGAPEKDIADFVQKLTRNPPDLWACLMAFMTVSAKYGIEHKSMYVYWGVASLSLERCEPYDALEFEYRSRPDAASEWSKRFAALPENWHREAVAAIAKQRKRASPIDFKRLDRFKEIEEDTAAAEKARPPAGGKPASNETKRFLDAFRAYMAAKTKAARVDLDKVIECLNGQALEACLYAYIDASARYPPDDTFSLYAFFGLSSRAMHWSGGYFGLKFQAWVKSDPRSDWAKRFAALNGEQRKALEADFVYANKHTRILDELRFAYYQAKGRDPDDRALRDFDVPVDAGLRNEVSGALAEYDRDCAANDVRGFASSWDRFDKLLEQKNRLTLTMVVKWCRDWLGSERVMRDELYWNAVGALFVRLLLDRPEEYKNGLNKEEEAYFVSGPSVRRPYLDDYSYRLRYLWTTRNHERFRQLCKVHAALIIYANKRQMRLATMAETARVYSKLRALDEHGPTSGVLLSVPVTERPGLLQDKHAMVGLGETFGDITIVWFEGLDTAYVECRSLDKVLFVMHETAYSHRLGDLTTARFYDELARGTEDLLVLIPAFFQVLAYLPDLVSGGLTAFVKTIAIQYAIGTGTEAVLGEGPAADVVAGFLAVATGHLTSAENAGTKSVAAELRAGEDLEHAGISSRGLADAADHGGAASAGAADRSIAAGGADLPTLDAESIVPHEPGTPAPHQPAEPVAPDGPAPRDEPAPAKAPTDQRQRAPKVDKLAARETEEEHDLLAAADKGKGKPAKKTAGKGSSAAEHDERGTKGRGMKRDPEDDAVKGARGTERKGTPRRPPPPPPPPAPRQLDPAKWYATPTFERGGISYRFVGPGASFDAVENNIATRFQVYEIRNARGETVYVGISGGKSQPRDALVRLKEHLVTKQGAFIGDAAEIRILGVDLDERVARGLEDNLIDQKNPFWNNRERDPDSYLRKYGQKPSVEEVRAANNANIPFRIELLPDPPPK